MNKKLILLVTVLIIIFASGCGSKSASNKLNGTKSSGTVSDTADKNSSKVSDVKKEDDKIIQEAIDTMDDIKLDDINDGILDDSELNSILKDKDDPIRDIPVK